ncbi:methylthioribose-1-phosphate isomerase [Methylohalomonas lacus]|uniref:Methylthioribose-1-phosphate isomerase n=1 Tax=Methylohalomonas lacus TaxID=398773 RepID=A0AAE3HJJ1_9GAMM|nr:S-methyl-5-thioribose-1-phosphate isomerase [Methylohalomonas lacus]MCS3902281.1 methylthioribose-1-phosphate isomerase [Methylohalomonas lacus]
MSSLPQTDGLPDTIRAIVWDDDRLQLLDQRQLPGQSVWLTLDDAPAVARAIHDMVVRGAPAIGIAAAYGVVLAARAAYRDAGPDWRAAIEPDLTTLAAARPTAINLNWALARMRAAFTASDGDPEPQLLQLAAAIQHEDIAANRHMGALGADLIDHDRRNGGAVLTHCNTGSLATGGFGTALGVVRTLYGRNSIERVYATETRPWLQGARLTAWELQQDRIPATLIADSAAAALLAQGGVHWVIVGADRVAANGDVANKIGTYALALAARRHDVGFMVVAPTSTIDTATASGADIPIEDRGAAELLSYGGHTPGVADMPAWNPVFDVTPAELVDALVTEKGVLTAPDSAAIDGLMRA